MTFFADFRKAIGLPIRHYHFRFSIMSVSEAMVVDGEASESEDESTEEVLSTSKR